MSLEVRARPSALRRIKSNDCQMSLTSVLLAFWTCLNAHHPILSYPCMSQPWKRAWFLAENIQLCFLKVFIPANLLRAWRTEKSHDLRKCSTHAVKCKEPKLSRTSVCCVSNILNQHSYSKRCTWGYPVGMLTRSSKCHTIGCTLLAFLFMWTLLPCLN